MRDRIVIVWKAKRKTTVAALSNSHKAHKHTRGSSMHRLLQIDRCADIMQCRHEATMNVYDSMKLPRIYIIGRFMVDSLSTFIVLVHIHDMRTCIRTHRYMLADIPVLHSS